MSSGASVNMFCRLHRLAFLLRERMAVGCYWHRLVPWGHSVYTIDSEVNCGTISGGTIMTTHIKKPVFVTKSGRVLAVTPGTEHPVSVDEMRKRRDAWYERNKQYLKGYSVDVFIAEKRRDVAKGLL